MLASLTSASTISLTLICSISCISGILMIILLIRYHYKSQQQQQNWQQNNIIQQQKLAAIQQKTTELAAQREQLQALLQSQQTMQQQWQKNFEQQQRESLSVLQQTANNGLQTISEQVRATLNQHNQHSNEKIQQLTNATQNRLQEIGNKVDKQLASGFEKTTATFADVMRRLAIIDQAQQKITELSSHVVNLQEVLTDKHARGSFGEVQLHSLVKQVLPAAHYSLQHTLSNAKRVDCLLHLPEPTGKIAVDAKFPLENYRIMINNEHSKEIRQKAKTQFKQDIKKHIKDIASKYIIPAETSDGAIMFIPAESVFAEIHANHDDLVAIANNTRVWIASPTTMMAILNTARAVLKDAATREQVHIIQQHLHGLNLDFSRFQKRMDNLAKHIDQAQKDVEEVHTSSRKISSRFAKIEAVQLDTNKFPNQTISQEKNNSLPNTIKD